MLNQQCMKMVSVKSGNGSGSAVKAFSTQTFKKINKFGSGKDGSKSARTEAKKK